MNETPEQKAEREAAEKAAEAEKAPKTATKKDAPPKRYAAYNKSLGRFVGGVRDNKSEADKIAKGVKDAGYTAEVREV